MHRLIAGITLASVAGLVNAAVNTTTLNGKFVVGYQGWFRAIGQDDGNSHWARDNNQPIGPGNVGVDFLPDVRGYPSRCLFDTAFTLPNGKKAQFYSSDCDGVIDYHFSLMQANNIDGVFLQRFYGYITDTPGRWTNVTLATKAAAEKYGRGFTIEYDLSSASSSTSDIATTLLRDLSNLTKMGVITSPAYFHHNGKPVVELWGFGINSQVTVEDAQHIVNSVKSAGYYVVLGVQQAWRSELSMPSPPHYGSVYRLADTIQPWTVGSFNKTTYPGFYTGTEIPDSQQLAKLNISYSIVSWPGASSANSGNGPYDAYPRYNGSYYQTQLNNAISLKPQFLFTAMFDELNEGTAIMPTLHVSELPTNQRFVGIDNNLDSSFYLAMAGNASRAFKNAVGQPS